MKNDGPTAQPGWLIEQLQKRENKFARFEVQIDTCALCVLIHYFPPSQFFVIRPQARARIRRILDHLLETAGHRELEMADIDALNRDDDQDNNEEADEDQEAEDKVVYSMLEGEEEGTELARPTCTVADN